MKVCTTLLMSKADLKMEADVFEGTNKLKAAPSVMSNLWTSCESNTLFDSCNNHCLAQRKIVTQLNQPKKVTDEVWVYHQLC